MRDLLRAIVALVVPLRCARCGRALDHPPALCRDCVRGLLGSGPGAAPAEPVPVPRGIASLHVGGRFEGELAAWLHRFKYPGPGWRGLEAAPLAVVAALAREIAGARRPEAPALDLVLPVPADARRLRRRGFHPAGEIAREVSGALGVRLAAGVLVAVRETASQTELDRRGRRRNVAGAYAVTGAARARGASVLVVDDVTTTGATLEECARSLRRAGARHVEALCIARTPDLR